MQQIMKEDDECVEVMKTMHNALAKKFGGQFDMVIICHKHHEEGECEGVSIITELDDLRKTGGLIQQALTSVTGTILSEMFAAETAPKH